MENTEDFAEKTVSSFELVRVYSLPELPPGSRKVVHIDTGNVLLLNIDGEIFAISSLCPHAGGHLKYGYLEGYTIECPLHYWPFDVRDGTLVGMNQASLFEYQLDIYPVQLQGDQIYLKLARPS
ncbi:MAG: Rieske 2Fe-2S domain-containing protein [Chloroflexi bacterium]|uniref:Rieske 2Fe-2S domain-containing protein n=1 Tax=Candidatus Chlorohelix allophototropha TaxID=3003348 RepID=A0A8T7M5V0_9CHLR|nr:Rieske 2Fe-2S domain-containing protein [Chloroflexota bacterium]WJW69387.1 Rieske 2Fe-2S domain-containing protein [Chloroflexota bacterium L227-S17]